MENEEEVIDILCPVCSQPMESSEEVAECVNPTCAVYELETGTWYAISRHVGKMQTRLTALEAIAQQANRGLVNNAEWYALSPESRHRLNVYALNAEALAGLVRAYVTADGTRPTTPGQAIAHMLELANRLAPIAPSYTPAEIVEGMLPSGAFYSHPLPDGIYRANGGAAETGERGNVHFERVGDTIKGKGE